MAKQPAFPTDPAYVEAELARFIDRFAPEIAERFRACRAGLREQLPGAVELVYDGSYALSISFGANEKLNGSVCSLVAYPRCVLLYFLKGVGLPDPEGLLQGEGSQGRFVRLDGPGKLAEPGIVALIAVACEAASQPLPPAGHGRTLLKSISPRQRPRRPAEQESA